MILTSKNNPLIKETASLLSILYNVEKTYAGFKFGKTKPVEYENIKNSLLLCTYFSDKTSILTLCRDMGVLRCIQ